jgi:Flp pilus assembly protein TadD
VEAESLYRRAIALRPGDAGAHLNLGLLLREEGRQDEGDAEVATALELNPEFVDPAAG